MRTVKIHLIIMTAIVLVFVFSCSDGDDPNGSTVEYNIRVRGFLDGESTDFTCMVRSADSTGGSFFSVDSVINIERNGPGTFVLNAEKEGYIAHPVADTVLLTVENTFAEAFFMFHEEGGDTGTIPGSTTHFFLQNSGEESWPVVFTGPEGQDTVDIAPGGSFWQTDAGTGDVIVIRPTRQGYCAVPESLVLLLSEDNGAFTFEFDFIEQRYVIFACAEFSGVGIPFDLLVSSTGRDTLLEIDREGLVIDLTSIGEYLLYPAHTGLVPEHSEYTVNLTGCTDSAYLCIQFSDTTEYSLTMSIAGRLAGDPTDFSARYKLAMPGAVWDTIDIGPSGNVDISLTTAGYYMVQAWKTACITAPEEVMLYLDGEYTSSTASFTFTDTTTTPKSILVSGTIDTAPTLFNLRWKGDWESDWHEDSIDGSKTLHVYPDGEIVFEAEKSGFIALPSTRTLAVEGEGSSYSINFCFSDSFGYLAEEGIYVCDWYNYRVVRINNMSGDSWTTVGPLEDYGVIDGPTGIRVDIFGRILIVDRGHNKLIQLETFSSDSPYEVFTTSAFDRPQQLGFDLDGRIYITGGYGDNLIRIDDIDGTNQIVYYFPYDSHPLGVHVDEDNQIYVALKHQHRIIRMDDMYGSGMVSLGSYGAGERQFNSPAGVNMDDEGWIYVCDVANNRVVRFRDMEGTDWETLEETTEGPFSEPKSICFSKGYIYISLYDNIVRMASFDGEGAVSYGIGGDGIGEFHHLRQLDVIP